MRRVETVVAACMLSLWALAAAFPAEIYVSPNGDNTGPGTKAKPLATLEGARDRIRAMKQGKGLPKGGVTVWLRGGIYPLQRSFELDERDSGTEHSPIVYRAVPGQKAFITGGIEIPASACVPVEDKATLDRLLPGVGSQLQEVDLGKLGIADYGEIKPVSYARTYAPAPMELFIDGEAMQLGRWPNPGEPLIAIAGPTNDQGFAYQSDRPNRWRQAKDVWIAGGFAESYAQDLVKVSIDLDGKAFTSPHATTFGFSEGGRWYALNLLEEIDQPGEYYVDREAGLLYVYPLHPIQPSTRLTVSMLEDPMVVMEGTSFVRFEDLVFECSRGMGIYIERGTSNLIAGCTLRNLGIVAVCVGKGASPMEGVYLDRSAPGSAPTSRVAGTMLSYLYDHSTWNREGGTNHGIAGCDIYNTGLGGVILGGGDRKTLTPAGNYIRNCYLHDVTRWGGSYRGFVNLDGVGNKIQHCLMQGHPQIGISVWGNDHVIEYNDISDCCTVPADTGAIYTGRDWTYQGIVFRYNYLHDVKNDVLGFYLDDMVSGVSVVGNVIERFGGLAAFIGGGRDNRIEDNVFIDCKRSAHIDARGVGWAKEAVGLLTERLQAVPYQEEPWRSRYPNLVNILEDNPGEPRHNTVRNNIIYQSPDVDIDDLAKQNGMIENNVLVPQRPDLKGIPFAQIGLYRDEYRRVLPDKQ